MSLLQAGVDSTVIALWLGHADIRSTQPYIHADMTIKERALALLTPAAVTPGRYTPTDDVLALPRQPRMTMPTPSRHRGHEPTADVHRHGSAVGPGSPTDRCPAP